MSSLRDFPLDGAHDEPRHAWTRQSMAAQRRSWLTRDALPWTSAAIDLAVIVTATVAALRFRMSLAFFDSAADVVQHTTVAAGFVVVTWMAALVLSGAYDKDVYGAGTEEFRLVVNASLITAALVGVGAYLLKFPLSRGFFVLMFAVGVLLLVTARVVVRRALQRLRARGHLGQRVLMVGTPGHIGEITAVLQRERWLGYDVVGCLVPREMALIQETRGGVPVLGHTGAVKDMVLEHDVDIVFFTAGAVDSSTELRRIAWDLEDATHVQIIVAPNVTDVSSERVRIRPVAGLPLMHLGRPRSRAAVNKAKRTFDLVGASLLLLLGGPVLLALMAWIRLHDGGPALFRQTRVGRDGQPFSCLKLRSMVVDAERLRPDNDGIRILFKLQADPRITRPGHVIRRYSLDELPQLWNVLRGDMSLVGPRPPLPEEVARYEDDMLRRLAVLPGMTGLWQVSGRSDLSWEDTVRLDLYYVDNWSMVQDLSILARTFTAVVAARGAY
ncbi:MAG: Exopolysaccharide biosynthesis polyprenyl glycosylphosphotransferase [uncultured Nocardioides sp.]|uniref:Exopolysaccharide biosynthesis polyprenyl glycosylphosphotransferase n=1 Tax=uncultured Nocardioides sp. TaxID=198441 RepID=A0A6J4MZD5_9ACTN|nr:MAG: Exopolysaccharide biosynthesis polyprenyl glycosylphosphotransferase [uncultured Nocardioides sp.]